LTLNKINYLPKIKMKEVLLMKIFIKNKIINRSRVKMKQNNKID